ncbi:MAG: signal peptidase I, partial [Terriglobales bacterium]
MPDVGSPQSPAPAATKESDVRPLPVVAVWARDLLVSLAISAFIIIFLYQPVKVEGTSMMPGLEDQERIFVNKFVYRWEPIERGDIVVFRYPRDTT